MDSVKIAVGFAVLAFVLAAGTLSFAGLDPASKADAVSFATEKPTVEKTYISSKKDRKDRGSARDLIQADAGNTG